MIKRLKTPRTKLLSRSLYYYYYHRLDEAAQEALTDMPPRAEEELDPCTLHNLALMNMDANPTSVSTHLIPLPLFIELH